MKTILIITGIITTISCDCTNQLQNNVLPASAKQVSQQTCLAGALCLDTAPLSFEAIETKTDSIPRKTRPGIVFLPTKQHADGTGILVIAVKKVFMRGEGFCYEFPVFEIPHVIDFFAAQKALYIAHRKGAGVSFVKITAVTAPEILMQTEITYSQFNQIRASCISPSEELPPSEQLFFASDLDCFSLTSIVQFLWQTFKINRMDAVNNPLFTIWARCLRSRNSEGYLVYEVAGKAFLVTGTLGQIDNSWIPQNVSFTLIADPKTGILSELKITFQEIEGIIIRAVYLIKRDGSVTILEEIQDEKNTQEFAVSHQEVFPPNGATIYLFTRPNQKLFPEHHCCPVFSFTRRSLC